MRICPIWRGNPERPSFAEQQCSADDWPYLSYLLLLGPCLGIEEPGVHDVFQEPVRA